MTDGAREPLGSAAEEAARLADAVGSWLSDHLADGSDSCSICPLCQLISVLRDTQPEIAEHLGRAGESLVAALRATVEAHERSWASPGSPTVQHITIDEPTAGE
ncbi:MAG: DUF5304 family protein [Actinomycetes bacterium]